MSEEDMELLITTDDPGDDTLEEDTFHLKLTMRPQVDPVRINKVATRPANRSNSSLVWNVSSSA